MAEWRAFRSQSLGFMSRRPVAHASWHRPRLSHHAFIEVVPAGTAVRIFGVHLSAVHRGVDRAAPRLRAARAAAQHRAITSDGFHVLAGDFNTLAPGDAARRRPAAAAAAAAGVAERRTHPLADDSDRARCRLRRRVPREASGRSRAHAAEPDPHVRLDYVFVPRALRIACCRARSLRTPRRRRRPIIFRSLPICASTDRGRSGFRGRGDDELRATDFADACERIGQACHAPDMRRLSDRTHERAAVTWRVAALGNDGWRFCRRYGCDARARSVSGRVPRCH